MPKAWPVYLEKGGNNLTKSSKAGPKPSHDAIDHTIAGVAFPTSASSSVLRVPSLCRSSLLFRLSELLYCVFSGSPSYAVL